MAIIYKVSFPNGKNYIGLSINTLEHRKKQHARAMSSSDYPVHKAIKHFGIENTVWEVIDSADEYRDLCVLEQNYIKQYKSLTRESGYNCTVGGEGRTAHRDEDLVLDALKYKHRAEWKKHSSSMYGSARKRGMLEICCAHMVSKNAHYTREDITAQARACPSAADFYTNYRNHYRKALALKMMDELFPDRAIDWTTERLQAAALRWANMTDFQQKDRDAYTSARRKGLLPSITQHMLRPSADRSFKKPLIKKLRKTSHSIMAMYTQASGNYQKAPVYPKQPPEPGC